MKRSIKARILIKLKTLLAKYFLIIEFCDYCGIEQPLVWWCESYGLWEEVTGNKSISEKEHAAGICCPTCFDKLANSKGIALRWYPVVDYRFTKT